MRKLALATAATIALVGASAPAQASAFTGFYFGADIGYGFGDANQERYGNLGGPLAFTQADADLDGFVGVVHAGYAWPIGASWALGIEGDVGIADLTGDDGGSGGDINEWAGDMTASVRARLGVMVGATTQLFVTGGWAWADYDADILNAPTSTRSHTFSGYTLGGGLDFMVSSTMSVRAQYRYTDYDADNVSFAPPELYYVEAGPTTHVISLGASWHF
jgi:outer membrane immunogenic protein